MFDKDFWEPYTEEEMANYEKNFLEGSLNPINILRAITYKRKFKKEHPFYFDPEGLLIFCGPQGSGKTLSLVNYVTKVVEHYDYCIIVSNVEFTYFPFTHSYKVLDGKVILTDLKTNEEYDYIDFMRARKEEEKPERVVIEYDGIDSLKYFENDFEGVLYVIDEIQLEWNSLESKNISIEEMIEFAQQRKQRKHIVGTSQIYGRIAKPLREQIKNVVLCKCFLGFIQWNNLIDGFATVEKDGQLETESVGRYFWFHTPKLYNSYNTYTKMKRYKKEWNGHKRSDIIQ